MRGLVAGTTRVYYLPDTPSSVEARLTARQSAKPGAHLVADRCFLWAAATAPYRVEGVALVCVRPWRRWVTSWCLVLGTLTRGATCSSRMSRFARRRASMSDWWVPTA